MKTLAIRARAILDARPYVLSIFDVLGGPAMYLDIETDVAQSVVWLVGLHSERTGQFRSFFAKDPKDERDILAQLSEFGREEGNEEDPIYYYSCNNFDKRVLESPIEAKVAASAFKQQSLLSRGFTEREIWEKGLLDKSWAELHQIMQEKEKEQAAVRKPAAIDMSDMTRDVDQQMVPEADIPKWHKKGYIRYKLADGQVVMGLPASKASRPIPA